MLLRRSLLVAGSGGASFVIPPRQFEVQAAPYGAWPSATQAFYAGGTSYFGTADNAGDIYVVAFDHATGTSTRTKVGGTIAIDQHNMAAVLRRASDGRLVAITCGHQTASIYRRISTNPDDATSWAAATDIDGNLGGSSYTYPYICELEGEAGSPMFLFYRNQPGNADWSLSRSTDDGATWSAGTGSVLYSATRAYGRACKTSSTRIDFLFSTGSYAEDYASIYHAYYEGGAYYDSTGAAITEPFSTAEMTLVYDGSSAGARFPASLETDGAGNLAAVFPVQTGTPTVNHVGTDGDYVYARWNGSAWSTHTIAASVGMTDFSFTEGGLVVDPSNIDRVILSKRGAGGTGTWRLYDYRTTDAGATWSSTQLTSSGAEDRYPWFVVGHQPELEFVWLKGTFVDQSDYNDAIEGWGIAA